MGKKIIRTVLGDIEPEKLGFTSMHEHVMFYGAVLAKRMRPSLPPNDLALKEDDKVDITNVGRLIDNSILSYDALIQDDTETMVGECIDFKRDGADSILELSVPGLSINMGSLKEISLRSGLNIIASTGFYTSDSWPKELCDRAESFYQRHMETEIERGITGTDIRPGSLKIALNSLDPMEEKALRAAGRISRDTGLPLTIHPCERIGGDRMRVVRILREEGTDLRKVVLAHTKVEKKPVSFAEAMYRPELYEVSVDEAERLFDTGINLCFELQNTLGFEMNGEGHYGEYGKLAGIYQLIKKGYTDQMVLGNDVCGRTMLRRSGGMGYMRLTTYVIPALLEAGVSSKDMDIITKVNPARILAVDNI